MWIASSKHYTYLYLNNTNTYHDPSFKVTDLLNYITEVSIYLMGSIIHKSVAPTQHCGYLSTTHNQACVPANPEVGRKISYI